MKHKKKNNLNVLTFTKVWVKRLMWFSVITIPIPYIVGAFQSILKVDADTINYLTTLSTNICTMVLCVILSYMVKAFFGKYCEEKNKMKNNDITETENNKNNEESEENQG